jgi:CopG antitoxin of type II toxin-antitoxin system
MKKPKTPPAFKTEAEERKFWETHNSTDYIDWSKGRTRAVSKPEAFDNSDFNSIAAGPAGANQDRRQQARRAVSVTDQDVAGGESGIVELSRPHRVSFLYFTRCGMMESWPSRRILSFS